MATAPSNLAALQVDLTATSIRVTWDAPSTPAIANRFQVIYETIGESGSVEVSNCTECVTVLSDLRRSATYNISVVTLSDHLPSSAESATVNLGMLALSMYSDSSH